MKHGSLFSGIGGFDLAAEWMGWENVFHCEKNKFGQRVLKHYWPNAILYDDITTTDFTIHRGEIDIITGGFPCQPFSTAGKRKGTADDRHLWPEMLRAIREIQPMYVVGENVRGITNWNGGMVFDQVQADLEAEGFEVLPFLLPACAVNAPHRRDRIWFVAHANGNGINSTNRTENDKFKRESHKQTGKRFRSEVDGFNDEQSTANPNSYGSSLEKTINQRREPVVDNGAEIRNAISSTGGSRLTSHTEHERCKEQWDKGTFRSYPTVPSIRGRVESEFRGGNDGIPSRVDRIKALGNAVVPQVVYQIFKAIELTTSNLRHKT